MTSVPLSPKMLELLRCPCPAHASLTFHVADGENHVGNDENRSVSGEGQPTDGELICEECGRAFPVRDGIPVMLLDEARGPGD